MPADERIDREWLELLALDEGARTQRMRERFAALAKLDEQARREALEAIIDAEYALPDTELRSMTRSRLRSWARLGEEDPDGAVQIGRSYDEAFAARPASLAMRRAATVQGAAQGLTQAEVDTLFGVIPGLGRHLTRTPHAIVSRESAPAEERTTRRSESFWARITGKPWAKSR